MPREKNKAAAELGRLGGLARARKHSREQISAWARHKKRRKRRARKTEKRT